MNSIGIMTFEQIKGRRHLGSTRIRAYWVTKHWPQAEIYKYGKKYDAIIFQKAYPINYLKRYDGIKILDLCDPDWLSVPHFVEALQYFDGIICATDAIKAYVQKLTNVPIQVIGDHHDFEWYGEAKEQKDKIAKHIGWFGFHQNFQSMKQLASFIKKKKLQLTVISDKFDTDMKMADTFVEYDPHDVNKYMRKWDFVVLPNNPGNNNFKYKTDNKLVSSWILGLPVATTAREFELFMDGQERIKEVTKRKQEVVENYDIRYAVDKWMIFMDEMFHARKLMEEIEK